MGDSPALDQHASGQRLSVEAMRDYQRQRQSHDRQWMSTESAFSYPITQAAVASDYFTDHCDSIMAILPIFNDSNAAR